MPDKITKDKIIRTFLEASFEKSTGETSLKDVADKLGIKKASLYNHFDSREDMVNHTVEKCREYLSGLTFIPQDIEVVAKKYNAETVFKGIVSRFFKMHEKQPLFQIYTFVESTKYFSKESAEIIHSEKERLVKQTVTVLEALHREGKISSSPETFYVSALWFCSGISNLMSDYLLKKKQIVMENPSSGEGELFQIMPDDKDLEKINVLVESFIGLL